MKVLRWLNIIDPYGASSSLRLISGSSAGSMWGSDRCEKWMNNLYLILGVCGLNAFGVWLGSEPVPGDAAVAALLSYSTSSGERSWLRTRGGFYALWGGNAALVRSERRHDSGLPRSSRTSSGSRAGKVVDDFRMHEPLCFPHHRGAGPCTRVFCI